LVPVDAGDAAAVFGQVDADAVRGGGEALAAGVDERAVALSAALRAPAEHALAHLGPGAAVGGVVLALLFVQG
jgi:hypothetical protein